MPDNTDRSADRAVPIDPWAPPERRGGVTRGGVTPGDRVSLDKGAGPVGPRPAGTVAPADTSPGDARPPGDGIPGDARPPADGTPGDARTPADAIPGGPHPPAVHDQQTVTSVPGAGTGPVPPLGFGAPQAGSAGWSAPGTVPPPPVGPNGPGRAAPPTGPGGYPGTPSHPGAPYSYPGGQPPQYGYPAGQAPQFGYPGYPGYGNPWGGLQPANGMGVAALVLGILATVGFCMYGLGVILGILALVFGVIGRGRARRGEADNGGVALAGIILGSVGIVVSAVFLGFLIRVVASDESDDDRDSDYGRAAVSQVVEAREHAPLGHISVRA
ncbi:DUF4190 domain-containing protein [Streptomyces sp. NPDC019224]|uniref:DUF4190 domain-containing protein n=1 Tax=Streptomyces sp. NPDC019224 TaxID=3154484 RepID=UPI0033FD9C63